MTVTGVPQPTITPTIVPSFALVSTGPFGGQAEGGGLGSNNPQQQQACSAAKTSASNIASDLESASNFFAGVGVTAAIATAGGVIG
jgi:hypothetical protein